RQYWGLYVNIEQINMNFIEKNFGNSENGNLFKGDPSGDLVWQGESCEEYYEKYELKTNEEENDWSDLVNLIDRINNTSNAQFANQLEQVFHIHNFLFFSAINNFFVNLDAYIDYGHNYYVYHRTDTNEFVHIPWDFNFSFGTYRPLLYPQSELPNLPIFWESSFAEDRPLVHRMFQNAKFRDIYVMNYRYLMENTFLTEQLNDRIDTLADLIRSAVYEDTLKMFTNEEFEQNLEQDLLINNQTFFGLKSFIEARIASISEQLEGFEEIDRTSGIYINEFLASNNATISDENGEYDDWIEVYNDNVEPINMEGLFLSDDPSIPDKWQFPDIEIPAKDFIIIWADNEVDQGILHTNFNLSASGEYIGLYEMDGIVPIDSLSFDAQETDISYGKNIDDQMWQFFADPSPGFPNTIIPVSNVFINELMASNSGTIMDEFGEYEDWIEIYNANDHEINLEGLSLSDNPDNLGKWQFPDITIPAESHLLIWADNDPEQGVLHTNFKLSTAGEFVLLSGNGAATILDSIQFGVQEIDISFGREQDCCEEWIIFSNPTPGSSNYEPTIAGDDNLEFEPIKSLGNFPNPFNPETKISFSLGTGADITLKIYNSKGQLVKTLLDKNLGSGQHSVVWNGIDNSGSKVSSGIYFYKLATSDYSKLDKMILMK
ncbi:MAG: CotH kinase family protein, partial [Candidatus Cloacimonetes bacterium]|nr:CotH kinase family protein [Candidatus Cloacimonadota bacterium]